MRARAAGRGNAMSGGSILIDKERSGRRAGMLGRVLGRIPLLSEMDRRMSCPCPVLQNPPAKDMTAEARVRSGRFC